MMKRKRFAIVPMLLATCILLTGCPSSGPTFGGGSIGRSTLDSMSNGGTKYYEESYDSDYYIGDYDSEYRTDASEKRERMMTYSYETTIELKEEIEDIDEAFEHIMDEAYKLDGYLDSKSANYWSNSVQVRSGNIYFTVEIPVDNAETFVEKLREIGWMTDFRQYIRNMTLRYEQAEMEDDQVTMQQIEHDVEYSDFSISLRSVTAYTDLRPSFWNRVKEAFKDGVEDFLYFVEEWLVEVWFFILQFLLVGVPVALALGLLFGIGVWVFGKVFFRRRKTDRVLLQIGENVDETGEASSGWRVFIPKTQKRSKKTKVKPEVTEEKVSERESVEVSEENDGLDDETSDDA